MSATTRPARAILGELVIDIAFATGADRHTGDHFQHVWWTWSCTHCLLLYSTHPDGDQTLTKKIEKGAFIMPAPGGAPSITMRPSILSRMFRS